MSHGITRKDKMAYVGKVPWHGLGTDMGAQLVDGETMRLATLDWEVKTCPVQYTPSDLLNSEFMESAAFQVTYRSDNHDLLGVVGPGWTPIQNDVPFQFIEDVLKAGGRDTSRFETAMSLFGGKQIAVCANVGGFNIARRNGPADEYQMYLLSTMAHDGTMSLVIAFTPIRVVCNNTNQWAMKEAQDLVKIKHTARYEDRLELTRRVFSAELRYQDKLAEQLVDLESHDFNKQATKDWAATTLVPDGVFELSETYRMRTYDQVMTAMPVPERKSTSTLATPAELLEEEVVQVVNLFTNGKGNHGESKYDAINGLTEFLDHHRNRYKRAKDITNWQQKRFSDTVFGDGRRTKTRALNLLTRW